MRILVSAAALWQVLEHHSFDMWYSPALWTRNPGPEGLALREMRWPGDVCPDDLPGQTRSNALGQQSVHLDMGPGPALWTRNPGPGAMDLGPSLDLVT